MALVDQINKDLKEAMKARDDAKVRSLRAIKSALLLALTEKGSHHEVKEEKEVQILRKLVKQREDSLDIYRKQGREDLATQEEEELNIISEYLPASLSEEELLAIIKGIIDKTGASDMKDMGRVMGMATKEVAGRADGKVLAALVREQLSN